MRILVASVIIAWIAAPAFAGRSPSQDCQGSRNLDCGAYVACRSVAEARLLRTRGVCSATTALRCYGDGDCPIDESCAKDPSRYIDAVAKCGDRFARMWDRRTQKAAAALDPCPDGPVSEEIAGILDDCMGDVAAGLAGEGLPACPGDLALCNSDRATCEDDLTTCSNSVATCNAGTATAAEVLVGKSFSSAVGLAVSGMMPGWSASEIVPATSSHAIPAGYHGGAGTVAGDIDLISGNIRSGIDLFGVSGSPSVVDTSGATAAAHDIASGKTAWVGGGLVAGSVPPGSNLSGEEGQTTIPIPYGLYLDSKQVTANDADLVPENILSDVSIFGVSGSLLTTPSARRLRTGQTQCWDTAGTQISCSGTGQDGDLQAGVSASFVDNGDGTITDNQTGLVWEKLSDDGSIHNYGDHFPWAPSFNKIATLNTAPCFAGFCDWRMPNINELYSLVSYATHGPAVQAPFNVNCGGTCAVTECSCTQPNGYWSSTSRHTGSHVAWTVHFSGGYVRTSNKLNTYYIRAVRGGS
jgi:hypothetical protein